MGCDFPIFFQAVYSVWITGARRDAHELSDHVDKLHTRHADEGPGVTIGYHSFFVVFQRTRKGPAAPDEAALRATARRLRDEQMAGDAPFAIYAREHQLGAPVTADFNAGDYRARGYERGVVYAPLARPNETKHMAW